jgi:hypothetical protein
MIQAITNVKAQVKELGYEQPRHAEMKMSRVPFVKRKICHVGEVWDPTKNFPTPQRLTFFSEPIP